eukprot:gene9440-1683_t
MRVRQANYLQPNTTKLPSTNQDQRTTTTYHYQLPPPPPPPHPHQQCETRPALNRQPRGARQRSGPGPLQPQAPPPPQASPTQHRTSVACVTYCSSKNSLILFDWHNPTCSGWQTRLVLSLTPNGECTNLLITFANYISDSVDGWIIL